MKLKNYTLNEVIDELAKLSENGCKHLCVKCDTQASLDDDNEFPLVDGENVTKVYCKFATLKNGNIIPVIIFDTQIDNSAMKLANIISYLKKLPIKSDAYVGLRFDNTGCNYKYNCGVIDIDCMWNVVVE